MQPIKFEGLGGVIRGIIFQVYLFVGLKLFYRFTHKWGKALSADKVKDCPDAS